MELPAGTLEPNEDPQTTAVRELQEEAGVYPGTVERVGGFYSAPGFCSEFLHLFIARDLRPSPMERDPDEDIDLVPTELSRVPDLILSGEIKDAKSIAGLLTLSYSKRGARPPGGAVSLWPRGRSPPRTAPSPRQTHPRCG